MKNSHIDLPEIKKDIKILNFSRFSILGKLRFKKLIMNKLKNVYTFRFTPKIHNIESTNDKYDILLLAHYDTHLIKIPAKLNSHFNKLRSLLGNNYPTIFNILKWITVFIFPFLLLYFILNIFFIIGVLIKQLDISPTLYNSTLYLINNFYKISPLSLLILLPYKNFGDDNNSGIVSIIHLTKLLYKKNLHSKVKVLFTNYEEFGILGSRVFLKRHAKELKDKIIINLDCVGRGSRICISCHKKNTLIGTELYNQLKSSGFKVSINNISYSDDKIFAKNNLNVAGIARYNTFSHIPWIHTSDDIPNKVDEFKIAQLIETLQHIISKEIAND